jgi:hypothetical protein
MKGSVEAKITPKAVTFAHKIDEFVKAWIFVKLAEQLILNVKLIRNV